MYYLYKIDLKIRRIRGLGCSKPGRQMNVTTHLIVGHQWALRESIVTREVSFLGVSSDSSPCD